MKEKLIGIALVLALFVVPAAANLFVDLTKPLTQEQALETQEQGTLFMGAGQPVEGKDYNMLGLSGIKEDEKSRLVVTPLNAISPINDFWQEFELTNKSDQNRAQVFAAYVFDRQIKGEVQYWKPAVIEWTEHEFVCQSEEFHYELNYYPLAHNPHFGWCTETCTDIGGQNPYDCNNFEGSFKSGNLEQKTIQYDRREITSRAHWIDVTDNFSHYQVPSDLNRFAGRQIYYYDGGFSINAGETKKWRINYSANLAHGKWDLVVWTGDSWNCILKKECDYKLIFDPGWVQGGWTYRKKIEIDNQYIDDVLVNFTALVHLDDDSDLTSNALADGNDLRFTDSDGTTLLSFEKEHYGVNGSDMNGELWVKIPRIASDANTVFYMYYGNPHVGADTGEDVANTWDANYQFVLHMQDEPANGALMYDSANDNDFTRVDATPGIKVGQVGKIGKGLEYLNTDGYFSGPNYMDGNPMTIQMWLNQDVAQVQDIFWQTNDAFGAAKGGWGLSWTDFDIIFYGSSAVQSNSDTVIAGSWHWLTFIANGTSGKIMVNGHEDTDEAITQVVSSDHNFLLGIYGDEASFPYDGKMDEVRLSSIVRPNYWIAADYNFMANPDPMYTVNAEESLDVNVHVIDPNGGETINTASDQNIDFNAFATTGNPPELRTALYYSDSAGDANVFIVDLNLNDHTNYDNFACETGGGWDFNFTTQCTYDMNWHREGVWVNDPSLVLYLPLDVDGKDFSSYRYKTETYKSDANTSAKKNRSIEFHPDVSYIRVKPEVDAMDLNVFTFCFWINGITDSGTEAPAFGDQYALVKGTVENYGFMWASTVAGYDEACFFQDTGAGWPTTDSIGSMNAGTWYHVCCRHDGVTLKGYLNGTERKSVATGGVLPKTDDGYFYLSNSAAGPWDFVGSMDEVMVWNRALDATEIREIYNTTAADGNVNYVDDACDAYVIDANTWDTSDQNDMDSSDAVFSVDFAGVCGVDQCTYVAGDWLIDDGSICIRHDALQVNVTGDLDVSDGELRLDNSPLCLTGVIIPTPDGGIIDLNNGAYIDFEKAACP